MSRGLVQPFFPSPPKEYTDDYMADITRAFSVFLSQVNNAGPWRATDMVLTNLQTNDKGLEVGALFNKEGTLKITVRDLNSNDIKLRSLNKGLKGAVIVEISKRSPVAGLLNVNDVIIEIQKKQIQKIDNLDNLIKKVKAQGQPLYLTIINNNNQRRYLGVKLK